MWVLPLGVLELDPQSKTSRSSAEKWRFTCKWTGFRAEGRGPLRFRVGFRLSKPNPKPMRKASDIEAQSLTLDTNPVNKMHQQENLASGGKRPFAGGAWRFSLGSTTTQP